jgi:hypothetical protein
MPRFRIPASLAVLLVVMAAGVSSAQTVYVTKATAGLPIELSLNGTKIASATANDAGIASLDVNLPAHGGKSQTDVHVSVEACAAAVRVQLVEAGLEMPTPSENCAHNDVTGTYVMKRDTSFVVDLSQSTPTVWLTEGEPPNTWLHPELAPAAGEGRVWAPPPKGLVVSAGGGLALFGDTITNACGNVSSCTGKKTRGALGGTATMWLTHAFAVQVSYLKPSDVTASGSDTNYTFTNLLETRFVSIAAKAGATAGPARIYGFGGAARHWAIANTRQVVANSTVTVNGVATPVPGGTYVSGIDAPAWDWIAGGGVEFWIKQPFGIYVEGTYLPLKSDAKNGGEGKIDDRVISLVAGVTFHVFGGK